MTKIFTPSNLDSYPCFKCVKCFWRWDSEGCCFEGCYKESAYCVRDEVTNKMHKNFQESYRLAP